MHRLAYLVARLIELVDALQAVIKWHLTKLEHSLKTQDAPDEHMQTVELAPPTEPEEMDRAGDLDDFRRDDLVAGQVGRQVGRPTMLSTNFASIPAGIGGYKGLAQRWDVYRELCLLRSSPRNLRVDLSFAGVVNSTSGCDQHRGHWASAQCGSATPRCVRDETCSMHATHWACQCHMCHYVHGIHEEQFTKSECFC